MAVRAVNDVEMALLRWIDRGMRFEPDLSRWPLETRGLRTVASRTWRQYIIRELWTCPDTLPDAYCDSLQMPRRSTFGQAVRKIWFEHLGEEEKPAA
jgi:hypothetical protein